MYWTEEKKEKLKKMYYSNIPFSEISKQFDGKKEKNIRAAAERLGFKGRKVNQWTEEEKRYMIENYSNTLNEDLGKKLNKTTFAIQSYAQKLDLKKDENFHYLRKYDVYIDKMHENNPDFCYLVGLLMADGHIDQKRNKCALGLKESDLPLLERLRDEFGGYINSTQKKMNGKVFKGYRWWMNGSDVIEVLNQYELFQNKTFRTKVSNKIPSHMMRHFVRGYFDGDGCICHYSKNKIQRVTFTGEEDFLFSIKNVIKNFEIETKDNIRKGSGKNKSFNLNYNSKEQLPKIYNLFYKDANIYLERKRIKFDQVLENI